MKGLKKLTLATAIAAAPFAANAELKAMDDSAMGNVTGQSGVTIELEAKVDIKEVAYKDDGFLAISGLSIGGGDWAKDANGNYTGAANTQTALKDVKLYIDVAGANGVADTGAEAVGSAYLDAKTVDSGKPLVNVNWTNTDPNGNESGMASVQDGDLVIGLRSTSGLPVSYGVGIDKVNLSKSTEDGALGALADSATAGTTLISDLKIAGQLGPIDIVIQEDSNAMDINAYFNAAGTLKADFVGTYLDFELHNRRGDDTNTLTIDAPTDPADPVNSVAQVVNTSFAHAQVDIGTVQNAAGQDALAFNVNNFSGDLDLTNIRMGAIDAASIGDLYMTDLRVNAQMTVYGH